jgi:hypothetical protein
VLLHTDLLVLVMITCIYVVEADIVARKPAF